MEDGQQGSRTVAIVQARMASSRLPGKAMFPLPFPTGKIMIQRIVDQAKSVESVDEVIVATSTLKENDVLYAYCLKNNIEVFRGDENDVLSRFIAISKIYKSETLIRLTGDNPIIDGDVVDKTVQIHKTKKNAYTRTTGLPLGLNVEVVQTACLEEIQRESPSSKEKEHVTLGLSRLKIQSDELRMNVDLGKLRCTIDYPSDFAMMSLLWGIGEKHGLTGLDLIRYAMNSHPWIFKVNEENKQIL